MSNRTIIGLILAAFTLGFGVMVAYRLPYDSLLMAVTMLVTALIVLGTVTIVTGLGGWVMVNIERARHGPGSAERTGATGGYPPVMIFPAAQTPPNLPGSGYHPNSYDMPGAAPRQFTVIGGDPDDEDQ